MGDPAVDWLLRSNDPSVRFLTLTEVLGRSPRSKEARLARAEIPNGRRVRALLAGQKSDGGFGVHPYRKWTGAHWRLVSLVELGIPPNHPGARAAVETVLEWLTNIAHRSSIGPIRGLVRVHASQEGNALAVCSRLGLAGDERVRLLADSLVEWQWPDGGWNCDPEPDVTHSSFHESLTPAWGLLEYHRATGDRASLEAARATAELFLRHGMFRSERTGRVVHAKWLRPHYPSYWHYDVLQALRLLAPIGILEDERTHEAMEMIESKRGSDGRWRAGGRYWNPPGAASTVDVVNWGRRGPSEMITLNALRVLRAAGRLPSVPRG